MSGLPMKTETIDIDTMSAGREMDALVAEKVMGWKLHPDGHCDDCRALGEPIFESPDGFCPADAFSTWIDPAWEVVEKLRKEGMVVELSLGPYGYHNLCIIRRYTDITRYKGIAKADTAPLVICRVALKAKQ